MAMTLPIPERDAVLDALRSASARYSTLLRSPLDPAANAIGYWSVAEAAAHTTHIYSLYPDLLAGGSSPVADHRKMAETWQKRVTQDPERDLNVLAGRIDEATVSFLERVEKVEWEQDQTWHGGIDVPTYTLACILILEADIHGLDIAASASKDWDIPSRDAIFGIEGLLPTLPHFVSQAAAQDLDAIFELRIRGGSRVYLTNDHGRLVIDTTRPGRVDCVISADPVSYLLVGYGRLTQWKPILTGKIIAWGRKPWLSLEFGKLFTTP